MFQFYFSRMSSRITKHILKNRTSVWPFYKVILYRQLQVKSSLGRTWNQKSFQVAEAVFIPFTSQIYKYRIQKQVQTPNILQASTIVVLTISFWPLNKLSHPDYFCRQQTTGADMSTWINCWIYIWCFVILLMLGSSS